MDPYMSMGRPMTEEQKERMRLGREAAKLKRDTQALASDAAKPAADQEPAATGEHDALVSEQDQRRRRLLEGIDPAIAYLITDAELDAIEGEERIKAEAERKKNALSNVRASLRQKARLDNDLIDASVLRTEAEKKRLAEPVTFTIRLPNDGAGHLGQNGFRVDGFLYQQGQTYTRPRAVFESLKSNFYQAWLRELEFTTLDQHKPARSAREIIGDRIPNFEIAA
jgi:hypothetical protein